MEYTSFISLLNQKFKNPLPGWEAQLIMAPLARKKFGATYTIPNAKESSVLVFFYPVNNQPHLLLILRNSYKGLHSAEVALPGGKREGNESYVETALREAYEEVGVVLSTENIIGKLTRVFIPPSGFVVYPFVGYLDEKPKLIPDSYEVNAIIEMPIAELLDENNVKEKFISSFDKGVKIKTPYYDILNYTIWGATAIILSELKAIICSRCTTNCTKQPF